MDRVFLHVSEIGTVCNEVNVHVEMSLGQASTGVYDSQIGVEEILKNLSIEAASKPGAM